jgi:hypothetical protein
MSNLEIVDGPLGWPEMKALFYIRREGTEAGPYDLVQMAGLLRKKIITPETQSRLEGDDSWVPLSWQPQFSVIREMPANAVSLRIDEIDEETLDRRSPIPLPSRESLVKLGALLAGCVCAGAGSFCLAWLAPAVGPAVIFIGIGVAIAAQILIIFRMIDENYLSVFLIGIIPGYDLYFFVTRFWRYFNLLAVKYLALSICLGATWGLALRR